MSVGGPGVHDGDGVTEDDAVRVDVRVGVRLGVRDGVRLRYGTGVREAVAVGLDVEVGESVALSVTVPVSVAVGVSVIVAVEEAVGEAVKCTPGWKAVAVTGSGGCDWPAEAGTTAVAVPVIMGTGSPEIP